MDGNRNLLITYSQLELLSLPERINMMNSITFVSIGCAYDSKWRNEDDKQYPLFLQNFKKYYEDVHVNLVLIDPALLCIKCISGKKSLKIEQYDQYKTVIYNPLNGNLDECTVILKNVYVCNENITIFKFNVFVEYVPQLSKLSEETTINNYDTDKIDITNLLFTLNKKCVMENGVMIVHDFSGNNIEILDKYFSDYTRRYSDKILYGLSDGLCCDIDLSDPINHVYFKFNNDVITLDNVKHISPHLINIMINNESKYTYIVIRKLNRLKNVLVHEFLTYLHIYRFALSCQKYTHDELCICPDYCRELAILDCVHHTHLLKSYIHNDINSVIINIRKLFMMKKSEFETIFKVSVIIDNINYSEWMDNVENLIKKLNIE